MKGAPIHNDFNSIKVRLKHDVIQNCVPAQVIFQFHKGTIKTYCWILVRVLRHEFQFHKGTIKTQGNAADIRVHSHFNSIKVRLKLLLLLCSQSYPTISIP